MIKRNGTSAPQTKRSLPPPPPPPPSSSSLTLPVPTNVSSSIANSGNKQFVAYVYTELLGEVNSFQFGDVYYDRQ
ncbi:hypothetical protein BLOT_000060 [Blomia tropicalis]|nr:hypothetical protein BLOT_000060 [Blomia tropicalis]